jgi:hypothetical protein
MMLTKLLATSTVMTGLVVAAGVGAASAGPAPAPRVPVSTSLTQQLPLFECEEYEEFWACETYDGDLFLILK